MINRRNQIRGEFSRSTESYLDKYQIGVRGSKIGNDWKVIDKYDKSELVDFNYDLQHLPLADESVDCYVCNAILEHVPEPELAIYEMYRTLRPGGAVWVEVPFTQPFHAHPYDFFRVTVPGMRRWMKDFEEVAVGTVGSYGNEMRKFASMLQAYIGSTTLDQATIERMVSFFENNTIDSDRFKKFYSYVYFWGRKPDKATPSSTRTKHFETLKNICAPNLYRLGSKLNFSLYGFSDCYLGNGWGVPEANGCWTVSRNSELVFQITEDSEKPRMLIIDCDFFAPAHGRELELTVSANNTELKSLNIEKGVVSRSLEIAFPKEFSCPNNILNLNFSLSSVFSPFQLGLTTDKRTLGLKLKSLRIL